MLTSSLLLAAIAFSAPSPDNDVQVETELLPLYENSDEGDGAMRDAYDNIVQLRQQPIDINRADIDELLRIPGIDLNTVNSILEYRSRYGSLKSIDELNMVPGIDDRTLDYLSSVTYVDRTDTVAWYSAAGMKSALRNMRHNVLLTGSIPTYYRAGDRGATTAGAMQLNRYANTYLGDPTKHSFRYSLSLGNNLQVNLTGSKTAGEPFFCRGNGMGYDYYSYNVSMRNLGVFRNVILGQFRAQFGMGLVINNNFTLGKQAMLASIGRLANNITPHSSTSDSKYLQGVAATAELGPFTVTAFYSYRYIDATLNADGSISSILTDGYHRTVREMEKKNDASQSTAGVHLKYGGQTVAGLDWAVGASFLHTSLSRDINPVYSNEDTVSASRLYRLYYPTGKEFWNTGVDYRIRWSSLAFTGETALCEHGSVATINTLMWNAARQLTLTALQRYYAYDYHSLYGTAISEGGKVQNESAAMLGLRWSVGNVVVDAYSDFAYFRWPRYRVSASSHAWDNCIAATLNLKRWSISARYRLRTRQQDRNVEGVDGKKYKQLADRTSHRVRLAALMDGNRWTARSQMEWCMTGEHDSGVLLGQSLGYRPGRSLGIYASAAYFNTDNYDTRLYAYERGMLYTFNNYSYYGEGFRCSILLRAEVSRWLMAQVKVGHTKYFDRSTIGTAERCIFASHQTDIDLQLRFRF